MDLPYVCNLLFKRRIEMKIDIFLVSPNGSLNYFRSTDQSKTCREAKQKFLDLYLIFKKDQVKAFKASK